MLDLDAYFARIGLKTVPSGPTLATLNALLLAHVATIPFENLDVLLDRPINLALPALEHKLVHSRRGGYCFEQNSFFLAVLTQLGFEAYPLSARVRYQRPPDVIPPRTHVFLRVELSGESYLADVGVGGISPSCALRLNTQDEQATPHGPHRIARAGERNLHQVRFPDGYHDVYEFTGELMPDIDREVGNWYTSTHPASVFKQRLMVARALPDGGRLTLVNRELSARAGSGVATTRVLRSERELLDVLHAGFGLNFPNDTHFTCPGLDFPNEA